MVCESPRKTPYCRVHKLKKEEMKQYWDTTTSQMPAIHYSYRVRGRRRVKFNWQLFKESILVVFLLIGTAAIGMILMGLMFALAFMAH